MFITVAICTWNRAPLLEQTLEGMKKLRIPEGIRWELLIVNNKCTDDTDQVIARHEGQLPIRRLFESKQGLSNARNCAVAAANGELILWTDDDVLVDADWIGNYAAAFRRWPEAEYFGGMIQPWYERTPQAWITENLSFLQGLLVIRNLGPWERPFQGGEHPFGANMAFRRSILKGKLFNPELGRMANEGILGEESAFFRSLRAEGVQGVWVPDAQVKHYIPSQRMTLGYLWDFFHGAGRTDVRMDGPPDHDPSTGSLLWGAPRWLYRQRLELWVRAYWRRLLRRPDWVRSYGLAARVSGVICETRRLHAAASTAAAPLLNRT